MQINRKIKRFYLENIRKELKATVENLSKQVYFPFSRRKEDGCQIMYTENLKFIGTLIETEVFLFDGSIKPNH